IRHRGGSHVVRMDGVGHASGIRPMSTEVAPRPRWRPSVLLSVYGRVIVRLRWFVVLFWAVATGAAVLYLPAVGQGGSDLSELVSKNNPAVQSEVRSFEAFGFPLLSRVAVVQRNPKGLPASAATDAATR